MKWVIAALVVLLLALQYRLFFGAGSVQEVRRLHIELASQRSELERMRMRNAALEAEVTDLKSGLEAIEERARTELGMIEEGETFYRFIRDRARASSAAASAGPAAVE